MENSTFRLRPFNENTLDEIRNHYLWFSKPDMFNFEDCNLSAVVNQNENINQALTRIFESKDEILEKSKHIGICCFTKKHPNRINWKKFPNGRKSVLIEYNRQIIENFLTEKFGLVDCFQEVSYIEKPMILGSTSPYDILWENKAEGDYYKSLESIFKDPKLFDKLFRKIFTRIKKNFEVQNEERIILAGDILSLIGSYNNGLKGYKIIIPEEAIKKVYIPKRLMFTSNIKIPVEFIE